MKGFIEYGRGAYRVQLSLTMAQEFGRKGISQNGTAAAGAVGLFCFGSKGHNRSVDKRGICRDGHGKSNNRKSTTRLLLQG